MTRIYAVGDIHGRKYLLDCLLDKLYKDEQLDLSKDKIVFLGDFVDRGPDSKGVLDKVKALTEAHPSNVIALRGNHEDMLIDAHIIGKRYIWEINGGTETLNSFPGSKIPEEYIKWLSTLPYQHEEPGFFFSHAPVPMDNRRPVYLRGQPYNIHELTWTRTRNVKDEETIPECWINKVGVCGHNHALSYRPQILKPRFYANYIFCDAGCGCLPSAPLCAVEVITRKVVFSYP